MKARVIIVEDEPLARASLAELVSEVDWLETVAEAEDGLSAVERIDALHPDLVFLDVEMPGLSGIEVLERAVHRPAVVFTTAYERYAVAAFELAAIDYLVKPFGRKRFHATLDRVKRRLPDPPPADQGARARLAFETGPPRRLFARKGTRIVPIATDDVAEIRGADDYSEVLARGESFLVDLTLNELESRLDSDRFLRIHRSSIVNLDHVASIETEDQRRLLVVLRNGSRIVASRSGSLRLRSRLRGLS